MTNYYFFFGLKNPNAFMSQWFPAKMVIDGITFPTAEHYMMYMKAEIFNDDDIKAQILATKSPRVAKKLGRRVKNFDNEVWKNHREAVILNGNMAKFSQNRQLKEQLMATGDAVLAEASPFDKVYGIGMRYTHKDVEDQSKWKGLNLLGKAIMRVRADLSS